MSGLVRPGTPLPWKVVRDDSGRVEVQNVDTGVTVAVMDEDNADADHNARDAESIVSAMHHAFRDEPVSPGSGRPYKLRVRRKDRTVHIVRTDQPLHKAVDEVMGLADGETLFGFHPEPSQAALGRHVELYPRRTDAQEARVRRAVVSFLEPLFEEMEKARAGEELPDKAALVLVMARLPHEDLAELMVLRGAMSRTERIRTVLRRLGRGELPAGYPSSEVVESGAYLLVGYGREIPCELPGVPVLHLHPADTDIATGDDKLEGFPWGDVLTDGNEWGDDDEKEEQR